MAITSLVVRIGAQDQDVQKALAVLGERAKTVDAELARLGSTPIGRAALKSLEQIQASMKSVTDAQQKLADRAVNAARGLELIGGATKFTSDELNSLSRTLTKGIDAFRALGQEAPPELTKVSKAIAAQQGALQSASKSWDEFVKGFNIENAIANPMATAKQAAFAFAESIGGVALTAAASIAGLVALGAAIYKLASNAAAVGSNLDDMADKTGMSVPALSRLQNAAKVAGSDLGTLTNAVVMVEQRMGQGGAKWDEAVSKMGLSTEALRSAGPDQLLELIAAGLAGIPDPADRAATGAALMGKSFKDVVPVLADLNAAFALTNDITPWTAEQAKDAEAFEMQMSSLVTHAEALGTALGRDLIPYVSAFVSAVSSVTGVLVPLIGRLTGITGIVELFGEAWRTAAAAIDVFRGKATKLPTITGDAAKGVKKWQDSVEGLAAKVPTLTDALITEEFASKDLTARHGELARAHDKAAAAVVKHAEEVKKFNATTVVWQGHLTQLGTAIPENTKHIEEMAGKFADARADMDNLTSSFNEFKGGITVAGDEMSSTTIPMFTTLPKVVAQSTEQIGKATVAVASLSDTLKGSLSDSLAKIPDMLIRAFEGGGGILGAIKAIGVSLSEAILKPIMASLSKLQQAGVSAGAGVATALGGAAGGGTGAAIAGIAGSLGGAALAASAWGTSMAAAGVAGTVALGAATLGIGAAAIGVYALVKHFSSLEKKINPVREEFVRLHGGLKALNEQAAAAGTSLNAMLDAKTPAQYKAAIDALNDALQLQDDSMKVLDETIQKYGFSIEELGPKWAAQKLNEQAGTLLQDYQVLTAAGVDHIAIINKMAPSLQEYVSTAQKTGTAIPEALRPILESMIELGLLTDASGAKMTDLEGLTFTETLDKKFSTLIDTINLLTDAISRGLGTAIKNIPQPGAIHVPVIFDPRPGDYRGFAGGGIVQRFASGGRVLPFLAHGTDTVPAMLTPGERVLSVTETQAYEAGGRANGGGNTALLHRIDQLDRRMAARDRTLPKMIRDAILLAS